HLTVVNGVAFFTASDGVHGSQLWRTDGTPGGTYALPGPVSPRALTIFDHGFAPVSSANLVFFITNGATLRRSDGTAGGTYIVQTSPFGPPTQWTPWGSRLAFASGGSLWVSDGTVAGTVRIANGLSVGSMVASD